MLKNIYWPAAAVVIVAICANAALLFAGKEVPPALASLVNSILVLAAALLEKLFKPALAPSGQPIQINQNGGV